PYSELRHISKISSRDRGLWLSNQRGAYRPQGYESYAAGEGRPFVFRWKITWMGRWPRPDAGAAPFCAAEFGNTPENQIPSVPATIGVRTGHSSTTMNSPLTGRP
ncbi:MAG: hypothetical protein ACLUN5_02080, partial [Oscillospiraceae bacterium]